MGLACRLGEVPPDLRQHLECSSLVELLWIAAGSGAMRGKVPCAGFTSPGPDTGDWGNFSIEDH